MKSQTDEQQAYNGQQAKSASRASMTKVLSSNMLKWQLHALICYFSVNRITNI